MYNNNNTKKLIQYYFDKMYENKTNKTYYCILYRHYVSQHQTTFQFNM